MTAFAKLALEDSCPHLDLPDPQRARLGHPLQGDMPSLAAVAGTSRIHMQTGPLTLDHLLASGRESGSTMAYFEALRAARTVCETLGSFSYH